MKTVNDLMVTEVMVLKNSDTIHQARMMLKEKAIRHIPVVDEASGNFKGLITQRSLLNHAFNIVEKFGISGLEKRELRTPVEEIMSEDCLTVESGADLLRVADLFVDKKASCLPVVDQGQLKGIVTSVDFVKLALHLLRS